MNRTLIGIVEDDCNGTLVVERLKDDGIKISFPSGDLEEGETEEKGVCREVLEETGQHVSVIKKLGERISPHNPEILLCYYACKREAVTPIVCEKDKIASAWYANKYSLARILGNNIYQPVKDYLGIA